MFKNYFLKITNGSPFVFSNDVFSLKMFGKALSLFLCLLVFNTSTLSAQSTIINPLAEGGFNNGTTFESNGWTVSNGNSPIKWILGTPLTQGAIAGNAAYVSVDNGATNSYLGYGASTIYFYKDITIPAGETNIALQFDWRSVGYTNSLDSWHVLVAPTTTTPVGMDTQTAQPPLVPSELANAVSVDYGYNSNNGTSILFPALVQTAFMNIPANYAGTTFRLIFMWTNDTNNGSNPPAIIDNISLISRTATSYVSNATGNYSDPMIWTPNGVPSEEDNITISAGNTVTIDGKTLSAQNVTVDGTLKTSAGANQFTTNGNLTVNATGIVELFYGTNTARTLNVIGNITNNGRIDSSAGSLILSGNTVQTVGGTGVFGGTVASPTTTNTVGIIASLKIDNSSTATPNVIWNFNNIRIKTSLELANARVALGTNKLIIGNYTPASISVNSGNGFVSGTIGKWFATNNTGNAFVAGTDYTASSGLYPFLSPTGDNRWGFIVRSSSTTTGNTAGELDMTYNHASTTSSGLSITDGAYSITNRYDGNWTITPIGTYAYTAGGNGTHSVAFYAGNTFNIQNGDLRVMNGFGAAPGLHLNGTITPFAIRTGLTTANLSADSFYVGYNTATLTNKTSVASGDWNNAATWSGGTIPACTDFVTIAAGHTVTVNSAGNNASGLNILLGGSLINASGDLTVGCTNNNALFSNFGTNTVSGGLLKVNGNVIHNDGSTFNHTNGEIVVDGNNAGDAATSVALGTSLFKILTTNISLTGGTITLVDPLVNNALSGTITSKPDVDLTTIAGTTQNANLSSTTTAVLTAANAAIVVGLNVTGNGIEPGTYVTNISGTTVTLSTAATISAPGVTLSFSPIATGSDKLRMPANASTLPIFVGQIVSGTGIADGTTIASILTFGTLQPMVTLSQPAIETASTATTLTFSGMTVGAQGVITNAGQTLANGQYVTGNGIQPGTTISSYNSTSGLLNLSKPATASATSIETLTLYSAPSSLNDLAFVYNAPAYYTAGLNHTLQIGDGVSTQKGTATTTGFLCNFGQNGSGNLSLGNLTINAPDGENRFFNFLGTLNVQNNTTVSQGVFKRSGNVYLGGNIINNGIMYFDGTLNLANFIENSATATNIGQTISGSGSFYNNATIANSNGSVITFIVNNTSSEGVTISVPDFRVTSSMTMTAGIIHTSAATPLKHGAQDTVFGASLTGNFSETCYVDGPLERKTGQGQSGTLQIFPVGKTNYTPIWLGVSTATGETVFFQAEAFTTNAGTASANISNLSQTRWEIPVVSGTFTSYTVQTTAPGLTANNIIVEAPAANGTYDNTLGNFATLTDTNTILQSTEAILSANFKGYIATATQSNCTLVNPGATIASTTTICGEQSVTFSLENIILGNGITYQWQVSTDGGTTYSDIVDATDATYVGMPVTTSFYKCIVTCTFSATTMSSTPVGIMFSKNIDTTTPSTICTEGQVTLNATAATGILNWYADTTATTPLATGNSFTTTVDNTTTFYVSTQEETQFANAGPEYSGTVSNGAPFFGYEFNLTAKIVLNNVKVYPAQSVAGTNEPITVTLFDNNGNVVPGTTPVIFTPYENVGSVNNTNPQTVTLNYQIPAGTGYRLLVTNGVNSANKLGNRNSGLTPSITGPIEFVGRVSQITGGSVSTTSGYYFWNWDITQICSSPRVPVIATVVNVMAPTADATQDACTSTTLAAFVVTGATDATFNWYATETSTAVLPTTTPVVLNTTYYVSQTVNGCESVRTAILANGPCLNTDLFEITGLIYYPNPVENNLTISANNSISRIEVYNMLGQQVFVSTPKANTTSIDLSNLSSANYMVKVFSNEATKIIKIVKR